MNNIKKLHLISLFAGMYFYTPIMTLFLLQRNIDVGLLIAAQTAFSVAMMAGELPTGILADRYGQKVSMRLGLLLDAFGMLQLWLVRSPAALIAYFAVRGISVAFRSGSDEALIYESHVKERGSAAGYAKAYGKFLSNDILGFIISAVIAGVAVQLFDTAAYVPMIALSGLTSLLAFAMTFSLTTGRKAAKPQQEFNSFSHLKQSLGVVKRNHTILALTVAGLLTLNGEYFLRQSYQPFFEDMSVPALFLGVGLAAGKLLNWLVVKYSHLLEQLWTVDQIIFWINATLGLSFIAFAFVSSPWLLVLVFVVIQGLFNAEKPIVSDYINQRIESHQRSTVLSSVSFLQNFGQIFARLGLAASVGLISIGPTYVVQGVYLIIGATIGVWYLRRCGCAHKVHPSDATIEEVAIAEGTI